MQRLALRSRSDGLLPHQLMMSATPIPRTLAMTFYADLDVSVIDELPPGRKPVTTKLIADGRRDEVIERVRAAAADGRQVYWVCPLIEESEALDLQNALATFEQLRHDLPALRVGLIHGRMPADEKAATMAAFKAGEIDLLVATTVIEVGVDVPNASLMVIEHAERFGLSQLHQLRGRVGRGAHESVCVLLYRHPAGPAREQRLKTLYETQRRVRDRAPGPGPARSGRVPRGSAVRCAAAALRGPGARRRPRRGGPTPGDGDARALSGRGHGPPGPLAGRTRGLSEGLIE